MTMSTAQNKKYGHNIFPAECENCVETNIKRLQENCLQYKFH